MLKRVLLLLLAALIFVALGRDTTAFASSLNSGTLFRYPWILGETRLRTQGQLSVADHNGNGLTYAVDWGLSGQSTLLFAANSGTLRCHQQAFPLDGFGDYVSIYNSVGQVTSIVAHMQQGTPCYPFIPDTPYDILQGQFIGVGDNSGNSTGSHIHFQVGAGDDETNPLISIPFTMSDHAPDASGISFVDIAACTNETDLTKCVSDGPSDNAGTGYTGQNPVGTDPILISTYLAQGGSSASWWNIGAAYQSINDNADEFGGVCRNTATAFVHVCGTDVGNGLLSSQNFIDYKGVRHSVYRSSSSSGVVKGQIQGALSNGYTLVVGSVPAVSKVLGAPTGDESGGTQNFEGGFIIRNNGLGIRSDVYRCTQSGCVLVVVARYSSLGIFCPSVNDDHAINVIDEQIVSKQIQLPYDVRYDLNGDGHVNVIDLQLVAKRVNTPALFCITVDP